jgi:hypothetical protein
MPIVTALFDPVREFFSLRRAEQTVRGYGSEQHVRVKEYADAADARVLAARSAPALPAVALLREALLLLLRSAELSRGLDEPGPPTTDRLAKVLPYVPADPADPRSKSEDEARVRDALFSRDDLYLDRLPPEELERTRWALDRACSAARRGVEVRSVANLRGLRWGRRAAVLLLAGYATFGWVRGKVGPVDVALGKPVHASSRRPATPDGHGLVDGDVGTSFAIHTNEENEPNVVIDLQGEYTLDRVVVYNRVDGWFDDCLPLVVEVSLDGARYEEVGRREQHFDADPPLVVPARGRMAHFVRLRVTRRSYLALSEVEVFGKPRR